MKYLSSRKFPLYLALIIIVITSVPYLLGYSTQGEDWRFTGFVIGVEDGNSYIAKMLRGSEGDWLFISSYSSIQKSGVATYLPYLLLGKLAAGQAQHEQLVVIFQLLRLISIFIAVFASYDFVSVFVKDEEIRKWALALIMLGGGLGWILVITQQKHFLGSVPLEYISPESFGFLGIVGFPHLIISRALLLWGFVAYLKNQNGYLAGICWLVMGFFQPLSVAIAWIVIAAHNVAIIICNILSRTGDESADNLFPREYINKAAHSALISSPILAYTVWAFLTDPYLIGWLDQNLLPSPHIIHYLIAYGLLLPLVYLGSLNLIKSRWSQSLLVIGWILIFPILVYLPINSQRRLAEGIWAAIVVAALAAFNSDRPFNRKWKTYLMLAFPSSLIIALGAVLTTLEPAKPVFRPQSEVEMYGAFRDIAESGQVVLSSYEISNTIPAWVPVRVVLGHGVESIKKSIVKLDINKIFHIETDEAKRKELLDYYQVDYIILGPDKSEKWTWPQDDISELVLIYNQNDYSVFRVRANE